MVEKENQTDYFHFWHHRYLPIYFHFRVDVDVSSGSCGDRESEWRSTTNLDITQTLNFIIKYKIALFSLIFDKCDAISTVANLSIPHAVSKSGLIDGTKCRYLNNENVSLKNVEITLLN